MYLQKTLPGRPKSVRTNKLIKIVKKNQEENPYDFLERKSVRFLARKNDCDKKTIYNIIHNDLGLKSYRRIRCQALTDAHRLKRRQFCTWVRKNISKDQLQKIMFSDEKMFNEDGQINYKNEIIYAESREEANKIGGLREEHKYPMSVMVWCGTVLPKLLFCHLKRALMNIFIVKKLYQL